MKNRLFHSIWPAILISTMMLTATFFYWQKQEQETAEKRQYTFSNAADQISRHISNRLTSYELILNGVKGLFESSDNVTREDFHQYVSALRFAETSRGMQGIAVVLQVSGRKQHEAGMRQQGFSAYQIRPEGMRSHYAPLVMIEPYSGANPDAIGFDLLTNPDARPALELARDSAEIALTGRIKLVQDPPGTPPASTVMYAPIYTKGASAGSLAERRSAINGWVSGPFRFRDMVGSLSGMMDPAIELDIYEGSQIAESAHIFGKGAAHAATRSDAFLHTTRVIDIGGKRWTLAMQTTPAFNNRFYDRNHGLVVAVAIALSLLGGWLVWLLSTGRERAMALAENMTSELRYAQAALEGTLNAIPDLLFEWGPDGRIHSYRTSCNDLLATSPLNFLGKTLAQALPAEAASVCMAAIEEANVHGVSTGKQYMLPLPQGPTWFELSVARKETGSELRFVALVRDITTRVETEQKLRLHATVFESSREGFVITDADNIIISINRAFTEITGYSMDDVIGKTPSLLHSGRQNKRFYEAMWSSLQQKQYWQGEIWNRRKNGEVYPEWLSISVVVDEQGKIVNYVGVFSDISQFKKAEETIHTLAFYDMLTELPNRQLLLDRLRQALLLSARTGHLGAILFIDIDDFKHLNDTRGYHIGDQLLIEMAKRIKSSINEDDTVARLGSDEFVVILKALNTETEIAAQMAKDVAEKIHAAIKQPLDLDGQKYYCRACIGISLFSDHDTKAEDLVKQADAAMFQAKHSGRDKIHFFNEDMQTALEQRVQMENWLRLAIPEQLRLVYQLQADQQKRVFGAEALIRWHHPEQGLISPASFIPLAETTGLILPIGRWVLESVCRQLKEWENNGLTQHLIVSVNVSVTQFQQDNFVDQVLDVVDQTGARPDRLKLELTESMLIENTEATIAKMNALKEKGISFSLDDFGTGYSSLSYLKQLPLDQIKIDQSFIRDILTDPNDAAIVRTIIALGRTLGLNVIAEGVETGRQLDLRSAYGCYNFQGYLFGKPVAVDEFMQQLLKN